MQPQVSNPSQNTSLLNVHTFTDVAVTGNTTGPPVSVYGVHGVWVFLPWHRYAIWTFETILRSEGNYTGTQPYWDWTLDSPASNGSLLSSPSPFWVLWGRRIGIDGLCRDWSLYGKRVSEHRARGVDEENFHVLDEISGRVRIQLELRLERRVPTGNERQEPRRPISGLH